MQVAFTFGEDDAFEAIYTRLEGVTKRLEEGGLTLDQTLALYEQGIALSRRAQALLDAAEQHIEVLRHGGD
ncbi:MAG: exodeoxyribonuclease VII small subunit [Dehalococcoidia bacterium]|nr:exodeoxyribonuclease VII small subunit [Dehalococcoidia bacterium]